MKPEIVIADELTFVSVSCAVLPALPIVAGPKSILRGEIWRSEKMRPFPDRVTFTGEPAPENGICRFPETNPFPVGAKRTAIRQLAPAANALPHVLDMEYWPEMEAVPTVTGAGVGLNRVTILGIPATPGYCPPKVRFVALTKRLLVAGSAKTHTRSCTVGGLPVPVMKGAL